METDSEIGEKAKCFEALKSGPAEEKSAAPPVFHHSPSNKREEIRGLEDGLGGESVRNQADEAQDAKGKLVVMALRDFWS